MKKIWIIAAVAAGLLALLYAGLRDIRRFDSPSAPAANSADPGAAGRPAGANENITTVKFVKNPTPVPQFTVKDLEGRTMSSADWRGKVVLLNFWATWCPPCRAEIPDLIKLQEKYGDQLQIVGLSDDTGSVQTVKDFVKENGINYPVALSSLELEAKFGGVMGLPTSFLVDTNGRVVQKHVGLRNPALYETEIRALLQLPVDATVETFEDNGQVLLTNAKNAKELPGIDLSKLTPEQKKAALRLLNEQKCTCGCDLTLAQCRINDTSCTISETTAKEVVDKIARGT